jgi:hypothetical protein
MSDDGQSPHGTVQFAFAFIKTPPNYSNAAVSSLQDEWIDI